LSHNRRRFMSVRIHVILPEDLVAKIDELAGPRRRSEFIAETLEDYFVRQRQRGALEGAAGSLKDSDYPDWSTPEKTDAWITRSRELDDDRFEELVREHGNPAS